MKTIIMQLNDTSPDILTSNLPPQNPSQILPSLKHQLLSNQSLLQSLQLSISSKKVQLALRIQSNQQQRVSPCKSSLSKYFSNSEESHTVKQKQIKERIKSTQGEIFMFRKELNGLVKRRVSDVGVMRLNEEIQKLNSKKSDYTKIKSQRDILERDKQQLQREIKDQDLQQIILRNTMQRVQHQKLTFGIRESKLSLQNLEKQDRYLTEKLQFFQNLISKKQDVRVNTQTKREISVEMRGISREMKQLLEQRDGVDIEMKRVLEQLKISIKTIENENWVLVNRLREYDAYLLKHYSQRKKGSVVIYNSVQEIPEQEERRIKEVRVTEPARKAESVVKKKELVQIARGDVLTRLSDFQLKPDRVLSLQLFHSNHILVGICATYSTSFGVESGYKMVGFPLLKDVQRMVIEIGQGREIEEFGVGYREGGGIGYVELKIRGGEMVSWGEIKIKKEKEVQEEVKIERRKVDSATKIWLVGALGYPQSMLSVIQRGSVPTI